jgi:hypothetical protein
MPGGGDRSWLQRLALPILGVAALVAVMVAGYFVGTARWQADPYYHYYTSQVPPSVQLDVSPATGPPFVVTTTLQ